MFLPGKLNKSLMKNEDTQGKCYFSRIAKNVKRNATSHCFGLVPILIVSRKIGDATGKLIAPMKVTKRTVLPSPAMEGNSLVSR